MNKTVKHILRFLVFASVGALILYLLFKRFDAAYAEDCLLKGISADECNLIDKLWYDLTHAKAIWIGIIIIAFILSNISRSLRWQMLIKPIGGKTKFLNAYFCIMLNYFTNLGIPRIGEFIRAAVFGRYEKIAVEKVIGTVVVDRIVDVFSLLFAIILAFILEFDKLSGWITQQYETSPFFSKGILILALVGIIGLALLWVFRKSIKKTKLYQKLEGIIKGFLEGIKTIRSLENIPMFIFHTAFIWVMYFMMTYLCFNAFEPTSHLGLTAGLMVFVFGGLGIVFPSPGGMGTYHAMIVAALAIYGIAEYDSFSFANILFFSINIFCNIVLGLVGLIVLPLINRGYKNN